MQECNHSNANTLVPTHHVARTHQVDDKPKEMKKKGILPPYKISGDASKFVGDGTWECSVSVKGQVMDAVKSAWNKKKTPLLIDASSEDRDGIYTIVCVLPMYVQT